MTVVHTFKYPIKVELTNTDEIAEYKRHQRIMLAFINVFGTDVEIEYYGVRQYSNPTFVFKLHNYSKHRSHLMWWFNELNCITYPEEMYNSNIAKICIR